MGISWRTIWRWVSHLSTAQWVFSLMFPAMTLAAIFKFAAELPPGLSIAYGVLLGLACFMVWHTVQWIKRKSLPPEFSSQQRRNLVVASVDINEACLVPVDNALAYVAIGEWGKTPLEALDVLTNKGFEPIFRRFEQRAYDGFVRVWGKEIRPGGSAGPLTVPIPQSHWKTSQLEPTRTQFGEPQTIPRGKSSGDIRYTELQVIKSEIEKEDWHE